MFFRVRTVYGVTNEINNQTKISLQSKDMIAVIIFLASVLSVYFSLKADIATAKILPVPEVTQDELDYQNVIIRNNILMIQEELSEIKASISKIEDRLYEKSLEK